MLKKQLEDLYKYFEDQRKISETIAARKTDHILAIKDQITITNHRLARVQNDIMQNSSIVRDLRKEVVGELHKAEAAVRLIERARSSPFFAVPPGYYQPDTLQSSSGLRYFLTLADNFDQRIRQYRAFIDDIDQHLSAILESKDSSPKALHAVLKNQFDFLVTIAGVVQTLHEYCNERKEQYLDLRKKHFNDNYNPFVHTRKLDLIPKGQQNGHFNISGPQPVTTQQPQLQLTTGNLSTPAPNFFSNQPVPSTTSQFNFNQPINPLGQTPSGITTAPVFGTNPNPIGTTVPFGTNAAGKYPFSAGPTATPFGASFAPAPGTTSLFGSNLTSPTTNQYASGKLNNPIQGNFAAKPSPLTIDTKLANQQSATSGKANTPTFRNQKKK